MQGQDQKTLQLSIAQILAGALASVSAAIAASLFGVAGTLIGAALTSIVATVGGAIYMHSIERARARVRWRRNPRTGELIAEPAAPAAGAPRRTMRWLAAAAALMFLLAVGSLTAVEAVAKAPVARLLGRPAPAEADTTVAAVVRQVAPERPGRGDAGTGDAEATPEATATAAATSAPPGERPAATATTSSPKAAPTPTAPSKQAPQPAPAVDERPMPGAQPTPSVRR